MSSNNPFSLLTRRMPTFTPLTTNGQTAWPWLRGMSLVKQRWLLVGFLILALLFLVGANSLLFLNEKSIESSAVMTGLLKEDMAFWQTRPDDWNDKQLTEAFKREKLFASNPSFSEYVRQTSPWRSKSNDFSHLSGFLAQRWPAAPKSAWTGLWNADPDVLVAWTNVWPDLEGWKPLLSGYAAFKRGLSSPVINVENAYPAWMIITLFALFLIFAWVSLIGTSRLFAAQTEQAQAALRQERELIQQYMQELRQQLHGWLRGQWNDRIPAKGGWMDVLTQLLNQFWDILGKKIKNPYTHHVQMMESVFMVLENTKSWLSYQEKLLQDLSSFSKNVFLLIQHSVNLPAPILVENLRKSWDSFQKWQESQQDFWLSGREKFKIVEQTVDRLKQQEQQRNAEDGKMLADINQLSLLMVGLEGSIPELKEPRKTAQKLQQQMKSRMNRSKDEATLLQNLSVVHEQFWGGVVAQQEKWLELEPEMLDFSEKAAYLSEQLGKSADQMNKQREVIEKMLQSLQELLDGADRQAPLWQSWRQLMMVLNEKIQNVQGAWRLVMSPVSGQDDGRK